MAESQKSVIIINSSYWPLNPTLPDVWAFGRGPSVEIVQPSRVYTHAVFPTACVLDPFSWLKCTPFERVLSIYMIDMR